MIKIYVLNDTSRESHLNSLSTISHKLVIQKASLFNIYQVVHQFSREIYLAAIGWALTFNQFDYLMQYVYFMYMKIILIHTYYKIDE